MDSYDKIKADAERMRVEQLKQLVLMPGEDIKTVTDAEAVKRARNALACLPATKRLELAMSPYMPTPVGKRESFEEACRIVRLSAEDLEGRTVDDARSILRRREEEAGWTVAELAEEAERRTRLRIKRLQCVELLSDMVAEKLIKQVQKAKKLIEAEDSLCYDIASSYGQIFDNVKHMAWFINAVAEGLTNNEKQPHQKTSEVSAYEPEPEE